MSNNSLLQNLYDCTVQVRHPTDEHVVGTGIVVSLDGKIITCGRVVRAAGIPPEAAPDTEVGICFPQVRPGEPHTYRATVAAVLPHGDEELVLLHLVAAQSPLAPQQIAILGDAAQSAGHTFRSYGYDPIAEQGVALVDGTISAVTNGLLHLHAPPADSRLNGAPVLDMARNLVVGIIASPEPAPDELHSTPTMLALDAALLGAAPFALPIRDEPLPLHPTPQPQVNSEEVKQLAALVTGTSLHGANPLLDTWVERTELLQALDADWADPDCRITGLIGSGGSGKTSLARHWLDKLTQDRTRFQPDGVFWWNFHAKPNIGEFFEAALAHMGGRLLDTQQYPSSSLRMQMIAAMLRAGHYLFVLDGLEVWQEQAGEQPGRIRSRNLRDFIRYAAAPEHPSSCLLISRLPITDVLAYPTYRQRHVGAFSPTEGRTLLLELGLQEQEWMLDQIVDDLRGHPLTLSLVGSYLLVEHNDALQKLDVLIPNTDTLTWQQVFVSRLGLLNEAERTFLTLLSAFRLPVDEAAFARILRVKPTFRERLRGKKPLPLTAPLTSLNDSDFAALLAHLVRSQLVIYDPQTRQYSLHPLLREHFARALPAYPAQPGTPDQAREFHLRLKDYYLALAGELPRFVTLSDLEPLIEAVHHACRAGDYETAFLIYWERIEQGDRRVVAHQLGDYETLLEVMRDFFPGDGNVLQYPQVIDQRTRYVILDTVGFCLLSLERVYEAAGVYATKNGLCAAASDWHNASIGYRNLTTLYLYLGDLAASYTAATCALDMAGRLENRQHEVAALAHMAWVSHLRGDWESASATFRRAEALQSALTPDYPYLYSQDRVWYADHLRQSGQADAARTMTLDNLAQCAERSWVRAISQCRRLLGDLDAAAGAVEQAMQHYQEAVQVARKVSHSPTLIEALLARGSWLITQPAMLEAAISDLHEALAQAAANDYRLYEARVRLALVRAYEVGGDTTAAQAEAQTARRLAAAAGLLLP